MLLNISFIFLLIDHNFKFYLANHVWRIFVIDTMNHCFINVKKYNFHTTVLPFLFLLFSRLW